MSKELRIYMPGDLLFSEGDPSGGLYFIQSGKVEVFKSRQRIEVVLACLGPGEVLGTLTVFNNEPRTATARAISKVEVQYMSSVSLSQGMSKIPVWAVAIIKDTIARLKFVDELYVQASLREKKIIQDKGNVYHHGAQLAAFYATMMRYLTREEDGVQVFPLAGLSARAEAILNLRAEYLEGIEEAFVKGGLIKVIEDKKWGDVVRNPKASVLEDFGIFANRVAKEGTGDFVPVKLTKWMGTLIRVRKKHPDQDAFPVESFIAAVSKDSGRSVPVEIIDSLAERKLLRVQNNCVSYSAELIQKRLVFEGVCAALLDLEAAVASDRHAA
jgi:CRP/FNR family cyclic AMP-dependent transcriptional regulator